MAGLLALLLASPARPGDAPTSDKAGEKKPVTITADRLEVDRKNHLAVYTGNVVAVDKNKDITLLADRVDFRFDDKMEEIQEAIAQGNVRITQCDKRSVSDRADYFPKEDRAILSGNAKVWQGNDLVAGSRVTLFLKEDRSIVEGGGRERVNAIIYPKQGEGTRVSDGKPGCR